MAREVEETASGLFVARDAYSRSKKKEQKPTSKVKGTSIKAHGIQAITDVQMETQHRLSAEERKQRRADNKTIKRSREIHRKRKSHGRN
jgi:hypothetical protein